jgi:formyl-CoA transferase/CoA:oxalate CoA-transferase
VNQSPFRILATIRVVTGERSDAARTAESARTGERSDAARTAESAMGGALDGIRVLDLGLLVQAPQAGAMFADMGAEVIKVELPGLGDQARWIGLSAEDKRAPYWIGVNRGKRSITLDLRKPDGRGAFLKLADTADVMLSNFKPGTLDGWGLGYDVLAARNPRLVYATGSAFGPEGAEAEREGADLAGQAQGGLISTTGRDGGDPTPVGFTIADHIASQNMTSGVLAALFARERTGRGQRVDVSLLGGQIWAQASELSGYFVGGVRGRSNRGHPLLHAVYGIMPTADGHIALVGIPPPLRAAFYAAIDRQDLFDTPRFSAMFLDPADKQDLFDELAVTFRTKTTAQWCAILKAAGQRYAPVQNYEQVANDSQALLNGYIIEIDHPEWGRVKSIGTPIRMSDTPLVPGVLTPELGQDTEVLLLELGYDWDEIERLRVSGSI